MIKYGLIRDRAFFDWLEANRGGLLDREAGVLAKLIPDLNELGLEIEPFGGNTFVVKSVPTILSNREVKPLIVEIVEKMMAVAPELHEVDDRSQVFFMRNRDDQKLLDFTFEIDKASKTSRADLKTINKEIETLSRNITGSRFKFFTEKEIENYYYREKFRLSQENKC